MNKLTCISRLLLGLMFTVFGLNGFLHFIPMQPMPDAVGPVMAGFAASIYIFPFVFLTQLIAGILLLVGAFVPLALVMLAPVVLHILFFHLFLAPAGIGAGAFAAILVIYLSFFSQAYSPTIKQLFRCKQ